ncbi:MAG: hypothetical protein M1514_01030 [Patescibacteria group bacterium]|nr:hypothetical protein [Patescibacteria group bacterium]
MEENVKQIIRGLVTLLIIVALIWLGIYLFRRATGQGATSLSPTPFPSPIPSLTPLPTATPTLILTPTLQPRQIQQTPDTGY